MGGVEGLALFIGIAFLAAGFVKGAIGVGLPTVVMGLLSIVMPPAQAAGLMVLPAIGTNIWQMLAGPALGRLLRRLAGMIVGIFIGTFATIGLMTRSAAGASAALGLVLAAYGAYALFARRFEVVPRHERWASPLTGLVTGMISGATGVFVIPNVPYLTALRMEREELVQLLTALLERSYMSRVEQYSGERIAFVGESVDGDLAVVRTHFLTRSGTAIPVDPGSHVIEATALSTSSS